MVKQADKSPISIRPGLSGKSSGIILVVLLTLLFIFFHHHREEIKVVAQNAVENYGFPALFFLCWFADVMIQPIPADFIVFGMVFGGAGVIQTALVAGLSSGMGGMTGYYLGKMFGPWRFRRIFGSKMLRLGRDLFRDHGALAILVAGISPIPYSAVCWVGGIYNMSLTKVILTSWLSRSLRYFVVAWLATKA